MAESTEQTASEVCQDPKPDVAGQATAAQEDPVPAWVVAAQAGDRGAMERLLEHFQDRIWRRARYRIGDHDEAWEVTQEVFVICFRKIGQFRGEAQFWTWLARIVDNQVKNRQGWWRRRRRDKTFSMQDLWRDPEEDEGNWEPPDSAPSPRQEAEGREQLEALEGVMTEMSGEHREILLLRFADGLAYEEIAEALQLSLGTVKSRINRARTELKKRMQEFL